MAQSVAATLPLVTAASDTDAAPSASAAPASPASTSPLAEPLSDPTPDTDGWVTCGDLRVKGGTYGIDYSYIPEKYFYGNIDYDTMDLIEVLSSTKLTIVDAAEHGKDNPGRTLIQVAAGVHAELVFNGVHIANGHGIPLNLLTNKYATAAGSAAIRGADIIPEKRTSLHLTLADGSDNLLSTRYSCTAALRCGEGSILTIDDSVDNRDINGRNVSVVGCKITQDATLASGRTVRKGDFSTVLDSPNPGTLTATGAELCAAIGGIIGESGGQMTINGGNVVATATAIPSGNQNYGMGAGIGGGAGGDGTVGGIVINGGTIAAQGATHGAGIGSGGWGTFWPTSKPDALQCQNYPYQYGVAVAGDITVNGGLIQSAGGEHGGAFGSACETVNTGHTITVTGGTLLPSSPNGFPDLGGAGGHVVISGGSVRVSGEGKFQGIGETAWGSTDYSNDENKVFMITINLASDGVSNEPINKWGLKIGGVPYDYGAPAQFHDGKLYLWLPASAKDQVISIDLGYEKADGTRVEPDTLFRDPRSPDDPEDPNRTKLKRYEEFELDPVYLNGLKKYYDGLPLQAYDLAAKPITPPKDPDRRLTDPGACDYTYQRFDAVNGTALSDEVSTGKQMPTNVGIMKFTMISRQYSTTEGFKENYWGHRAFGWCEIWEIPSQVHDVTAVWADEGDATLQPGGNEHPSDQRITVSAVIGRGDTVDGKPLAADRSNATAPTCKAPRGRVQLFVDGEPVGEPVELLFDTKLDRNGNVLRDGSGNPIPDNTGVANATVVPNGEGGAETRFTYTFTPSDADWLVPGLGEAGKHQVSLQFLRPSDEQQEAAVPANYLESADPAKDPSAPSAEVVIEPIDPNPTVTPTPDPDCKDPDFPAPSVETGPGEPNDPAADPSEPGDKNYHGSITTTWGEPSEDNPHPGRVTLSIKTPSTGKISVTDASGNVFTADFLKDADGRPVRGEDGTYTLVLDPTAVGRGQLTFKQEPNGAYTGSTWVYDVTVNPDVTVAPAPSLSKEVENLTHPDGPTQPGDRIRYTITAANTATGSLWTGVVVRDPLPACLELDEGSVRLDNPRGGVAGKALAKAPLVAASDVGKFALSAPGADGRRILTVPAGNVPGGAEATVTFECTVAIDAAGEGAAAADLANIAEATGTRPDPTDPDNPMPDPNRPGQPLPINPDPTDPVTPPGPSRVVPADPAITLTKTVENLTTPGASVTRIGDRLLYTVTLANTGAANSCLVGAVISDPLPVGIEPAAGTIQLAVNGGAPVPVPDGAYDRGTRTIAVTCGDLWGGGAVLTFEAAVEADALGQDAANIAHAHGSIPSEDPGTVPSDPDPGKPTEPPADGPEASSDPAEPPTIIPDDPGREDLSIAKTAENASRDDGTTHVGDTVRYRIALANSGPATGWMDAVIRDDVPRGLEPIAGTIRLALPDGREVAVDDGAYDPATRILAVAVGHLYGGQEAALSFDALVTKDALDTDIGNVGTAFGTPPSQWDPDRPAPEPGSPFRPKEGWDEYARGHESVATDPVYPPGVTARGGVLQDAEDGPAAREKQRTTIAHKLAQTGDALSLALLLSATLALAAGALALAGRRRARRAR